ncbi:helicase-related protein [Frankia sp. Cr2]|uniref:helicase-related protein n=1 Tax=Frankia sp. Cr2 TaxID=3073932 RepID=UPI002AD26D53|nr:helicase-related protein [Frankia sp. Cr2]
MKSPAVPAGDRSTLLDYLRTQLIGPVGGEREVLSEVPQFRYTSGILFPIRNDGDESDVDPHEIVDEVPGNIGEERDDDPIALASQVKPSSMGMSFMTPGSTSAVDVEVSAAKYEDTDGAGKRWQRAQQHEKVRVSRPEAGNDSDQTAVFGGSATLNVRWYERDEHVIVTVTLVNRREVTGLARVRTPDCLFQAYMRCSPVGTEIVAYPSRPRIYVDEEEAELDILFRNIPTYGIGHGVSVMWTEGSPHPPFLETSFLPVKKVPGVRFDVAGDSDVLGLDFLLNVVDQPVLVVAALNGFVESYELWASELRSNGGPVPQHLENARQRLLGKIDKTCRRMRRGVQAIDADPFVRRAFALANEAMLMQMVHSRSVDLAGGSHPVGSARVMPNDYQGRRHRWRPFQLAFLLLSLEGTATRTADTDVVDLIWFPTGGGKTEAYLALAAFAIFHRRLQLGDEGAGTTVITRYTLRLLTAQQFQRASTLICACEMLRRRFREDLGSIPISIGIWTGGNNSPNSFTQARELAADLRAGVQTTKSFQIARCPWCGTRIEAGDDKDEETWGYYVDNSSFRVNCLNSNCSFHRSGLPVSSVDDDLYVRPPTLLIGTVDKFAQAAWNERIGVFFGSGETPGPSLIIQDEFHLISGPLGTVVGLYEAAFDVLLAHNRCRPKIVASTATIRHSTEQTRGVFGREVALFPPSGLDTSDSYFVRTDYSAPGRIYAGFMPQGHTPLTALVHVAAALLQAPLDVDLSLLGKDAFWTLVAYHNSLRELGKTITLARDDVEARLKIIAEVEDRRRDLGDDNIVELTSNVTPAQIERVLERLGRPWDAPDAISLAASTNMMSVGVDIDRLGIMLVLGQPKTTAEYIQASSRVGRSDDRPGVVLTLYSPSKPRDRSHYESFVSYHSMLYRAVEPTSVTPFSVPARARALHADLVVLARLARHWGADDDAASFAADDPGFVTLVEALIERARRADPEEADAVRDHLNRLLDEWTARASAAEDVGLRYRSYRERPGLLRRFGDRTLGWPTLDSMRSVDVEVSISVRGEPR